MDTSPQTGETTATLDDVVRINLAQMRTHWIDIMTRQEEPTREEIVAICTTLRHMADAIENSLPATAKTQRDN